MFAGVAQAVRRTVRGQFLIGKKFEDGSGERLAVPRLDEQSVLPVLDNFGNLAQFRRHNGAARWQKDSPRTIGDASVRSEAIATMSQAAKISGVSQRYPIMRTLAANPVRLNAFLTFSPSFRQPVPWPTMTKRASERSDKTRRARRPR